MRASKLLGPAVCCGLILVGCGGAAASALFAAGGEDGGGASGSGSGSGSSSGSASSGSGSSGSGSSSGGASSGSGSSSGGASSSGSGSSSGGSSSSGSGSSSGGSSGSGGSSSSGSGSSSGGDDAGATSGIYCGSVGASGKTRYCKVSTEECCAVQGDNGGGTGTGGTTYDKCATASQGNLCATGDEVVGIPCDDGAQCGAGQYCCGTTDDTGAYSSVNCQSSCNGDGQYAFCDPTAATDECTTLGFGYTCTASTVLPGYYRCAAATFGGSGGGAAPGSGSGG